MQDQLKRVLDKFSVKEIISIRIESQNITNFSASAHSCYDLATTPTRTQSDSALEPTTSRSTVLVDQLKYNNIYTMYTIV